MGARSSDVSEVHVPTVEREGRLGVPVEAFSESWRHKDLLLEISQDAFKRLNNRIKHGVSGDSGPVRFLSEKYCAGMSDIHFHFSKRLVVDDPKREFLCGMFVTCDISALDDYVLGSASLPTVYGHMGVEDQLMLVKIVELAENVERMVVRLPSMVRLKSLDQCDFCRWHSFELTDALFSKLAIGVHNGELVASGNRLPRSLYERADKVVQGASEVMQDFASQDAKTRVRKNEVLGAIDDLPGFIPILNDDSVAIRRIGLNPVFEVHNLFFDPPQLLGAS